jgi:uncharacterized metal-binding protein YceD (DUF177 family)
MTAPEFSRLIRLDAIGGEAHMVSIAATDAERAALARRFGMLALHRVDAEAGVAREGDAVIVTGRLSAELDQACVATGVAVPARIDEAFAIRFVPAGAAEADAEIELDAADCDVMEHDGRAIDLGEAVAQTLGLAIDPFPRSADAAAALKAAGVLSEAEAGPFAALAGLKDKLEKR